MALLGAMAMFRGFNIHLLTTSALRATSSVWFQTEIWTLTE